MTGWRSGADVRTTVQPRAVQPAGSSTLMPPPSQGAERRPERLAVRVDLADHVRLLTRPGVLQAADQPLEAGD